ncbi:putative tRNA pseudouridine(55) synthase [Rosa chinensis]|uniref:tRNA pseudouridine(55) synthase n=2 Tax=Rosa chinensis TaxID=74649 RepID=A0A2P6S5T1_ROSCH|nr:putative tRNA pseudouridine(55) synthase [Rosa chinensis]
MEKKKRKYYNKRRKRMYGGDSEEEEEKRREGERLVELKPEVVEFNTLHKREEELYFYDAFAYPWEKDKHYKMVYQLEKKFYPDQCLDKAFLEPGAANCNLSRKKKERGGGDDKGMVFFEGKGEGESREPAAAAKDVAEKKVEEFFKCLKKVPKAVSDEGEPYLLTRSSELPPRWDGPFGTVVLVNKPKGWTSFTVCGKLRRLVKVKKVGHAGTLDPMATGLLIVCVGKATKVVDSYQGMTKGYSGVFRLGEATSTWDADSPVIQREPWEHIKDEDIKKTAASFCGEIWQVPPMFSAIKVGGEKMYEKARRGESIELSPRRISIYQFDIERSLDDRQNLIFRVTCSKGTYIRSLCADLGKALGSCAHLTALRRDSIGEYSADNAWDFKELEDAITKTYF